MLILFFPPQTFCLFVALDWVCHVEEQFGIIDKRTDNFQSNIVRAQFAYSQTDPVFSKLNQM